jgi:hypothetical protein
MKKTIRLGSFLLAFLLMVCTLPVTAWAASTSYDLSRALFRSAETQKNVVSYAKGEKATLTFTPQYTAEYTLSFFVHNPNGESGRNAHASLTFPGGKVQEGEYPYRPNAKDYSRPYITATLEKGKTYVFTYKFSKGSNAYPCVYRNMKETPVFTDKYEDEFTRTTVVSFSPPADSLENATGQKLIWVGIRTGEPRGWSTPGKVGSNIRVPNRHGAFWTPSKVFDEGQLTLSMWAVGCNEDGTLPVNEDAKKKVLDNLDQLTSLFGTTNRLLTLRKHTGSDVALINELSNPTLIGTGSTGYEIAHNYIKNPDRKFTTTQVVSRNLSTNPFMKGRNHINSL